MPFKISSIDRQRSIAGLAKSFYAVGDSPDLVRQGSDALLRANPFLADREFLRPGMPLVVPDLPFLPAHPEAPVAAAGGNAGTRGAVLEQIAERFRKQTTVAKKTTTAQRKLLESPDIKAALAEKRPDLVEGLPKLVASVTARAEEQAQRAKLLQETMKRATESLDVLETVSPRP